MKTKGQAVLYWGTADASWGFCDSLEVVQEAEKEAIRYGSGDTVGVQFTDLRKKVTGTFTPLSGAAATDPPLAESLIGEVLEITLAEGRRLTVLIDGATLRLKRGSSAEFVFSGYHYPGMQGE